MFIFATCKHKLYIIMSHIYYEKKEIPIPEGGHVNNNDGAVRIYLDPSVPRRKRRKPSAARLSS